MTNQLCSGPLGIAWLKQASFKHSVHSCLKTANAFCRALAGAESPLLTSAATQAKMAELAREHAEKNALFSKRSVLAQDAALG